MKGLRRELEEVRKVMGSCVDFQKDEVEAEEDLALLKYFTADSPDRKEIMVEMLRRRVKCKTDHSRNDVDT